MRQPSRDVAARIARQNAGRDPERLALKYDAMCASAFAFYRGSAHLFWQDARARRASIPDAPRVWACGDLHVENFGCYRGANGLAYFDLNDFDEAALAPATWEIARLVTSLYVAAPALAISQSDATELATSFLSSYQSALARGKAQWIERATATGMVRTLFRRVKRRTLAALLASRTETKGNRRALRIDGKRTLALENAERKRLLAAFHHYFATHHDGRELEPVDIAVRIAGVGSLGSHRYVMLVREAGSPKRYELVDAKEARPSSLARFGGIKQRTWKTEGERVVELQQRMQAVTPALLQAATIQRRSFILRALQPTADRLSLLSAHGHPRRLRGAIRDMADTTAWAQLRSSGREGSATADELIALSSLQSWRREVIDYARSYQRTVERDWREFVATQKGKKPK